MSELNIREEYAAKIEAAGSAFEKTMLKAERDHKLKMIEKDIDLEKSREDSHFVCVGCSG